jgi:phospholipid/cholesterol/gamma-HCH transport system permease protein
VPRALASALSVLTLAMLSSVIALVLAYLTVYGLSPWGLPGYTRTVGQVFDPVVTLGFVSKSILFSLAVAVVPMAARLEARHQGMTGADSVPPGAVRLFLVLLLIEAASLVVKYI